MAVSCWTVTMRPALRAWTALVLRMTLRSHRGLKMTSKNCETFWKKNVGMQKAISRRTRTAAYLGVSTPFDKSAEARAGVGLG